MNRLAVRLLGALSAALLVLVAGGGVAFFLFARMAFDVVPSFSAHPRYDAGELVGPLVKIANAVEIAAGAAAALAAIAYLRERRVARTIACVLLVSASAIAAIALAERIFLIPEIVSLREGLGRAGFDGDASSPQRRRFGILHGINNINQLIIIVLAWICVFLERFSVRNQSA